MGEKMTTSRYLGASLACALFVLGVGACQCDSVVQGSGVSKTIVQELPNFNQVLIEGLGKLDVDVGPKASITITADDNIIPYIRVKVDSKRLHIESKKPFISASNVSIKLTTPDLKSFVSNGVGAITVSGVNNKDFNVAVKGAGNLQLSGKTEVFTLEVSGAGNVKAVDLEAQTVEANLNGVGNVEVNPKQLLKAHVSGVGSVKYVGDPKVEADISGIGKVQKAAL